mgnify:CR=1 FL=1
MTQQTIPTGPVAPPALRPQDVPVNAGFLDVPPFRPTTVFEVPLGATHVVVLHTRVGRLPQGEVVPLASLAGWDVVRLLDIDAVKVADEYESTLTHVTLDRLRRDKPVQEALLNQVMRENEALKLRTANAEESARLGRQEAASLVQQAMLSARPVLDEKDRQIADLRAQLESAGRSKKA